MDFSLEALNLLHDNALYSFTITDDREVKLSFSWYDRVDESDENEFIIEVIFMDVNNLSITKIESMDPDSMEIHESTFEDLSGTYRFGMMVLYSIDIRDISGFRTFELDFTCKDIIYTSKINTDI